MIVWQVLDAVDPGREVHGQIKCNTICKHAILNIVRLRDYAEQVWIAPVHSNEGQ